MAVQIGDYYVSNNKSIPRILQDKQMNCWLYAAIMLKSWQIGSALNRSNVLSYYSGKAGTGKLIYGADFYKKLSEDQDAESGGLHFYYPAYESNDDPDNPNVISRHPAHVDMTELNSFFTGMGFKKLNRQVNTAPTPVEWHEYLKSLGPLIVMRLFPAHARLLAGTWSADGTTADQAILIDPAFGQERRVLMDQFQNQVGGFANYAGWPGTVWFAPKV